MSKQPKPRTLDEVLEHFDREREVGQAISDERHRETKPQRDAEHDAVQGILPAYYARMPLSRRLGSGGSARLEDGYTAREQRSEAQRRREAPERLGLFDFREGDDEEDPHAR